MTSTLYTIGHSTHAIGDFIALLKGATIAAVADVRSSPYSRRNPQFNRETLKAELKEKGIAYVFLGRELGARSEDASCYENGKVQYDRLAATPLFQKGLDRLEAGAQHMRIALMCAEKDPLQCHRTILVSRHLVARGNQVLHILADGRTESHTSALQRLATLLGIAGKDLFRSAEDLELDAYRIQGERIAYVKPANQSPPAGRSSKKKRPSASTSRGLLE